MSFFNFHTLELSEAKPITGFSEDYIAQRVANLGKKKRERREKNRKKEGKSGKLRPTSIAIDSKRVAKPGKIVTSTKRIHKRKEKTRRRKKRMNKRKRMKG